MGEKKRRVDAIKRRSDTYRVLTEFTSGRNDTRIAPNSCLGCGTPLDRATSLTPGQKPREGMLSVCFACGHLQAFDADLRFRELTDAEMVEVAGDVDVVTSNTVRGPLREFWKHDDREGAWKYILAQIRKDLRKA